MLSATANHQVTYSSNNLLNSTAKPSQETTVIHSFTRTLKSEVVNSEYGCHLWLLHQEVHCHMNNLRWLKVCFVCSVTLPTYKWVKVIRSWWLAVIV